MEGGVDHHEDAEGGEAFAEALAARGPRANADEDHKIDGGQQAGVGNAAESKEQDDQKVTGQVDQRGAVLHETLPHDRGVARAGGGSTPLAALAGSAGWA